MVLTATLVLVYLDTPGEGVQQVSQYAQSQWQFQSYFSSVLRFDSMKNQTFMFVKNQMVKLITKVFFI